MLLMLLWIVMIGIGMESWYNSNSINVFCHAYTFSSSSSSSSSSSFPDNHPKLKTQSKNDNKNNNKVSRTGGRYFTENYFIPPLKQLCTFSILDNSVQVHSSSSSSLSKSLIQQQQQQQHSQSIPTTKKKQQQQQQQSLSGTTNRNNNNNNHHQQQQQFYYDYDLATYSTKIPKDDKKDWHHSEVTVPTNTNIHCQSKYKSNSIETTTHFHDPTVESVFGSTGPKKVTSTNKWLPVTYTNDPKTLSLWLANNIIPQNGHPCFIGFDVESTPSNSFRDGKTSTTTTSTTTTTTNNNNNNNGPVVVQLATPDSAIVIHLLRPNGRPNMACIPILQSILCDDNIIKTGVSIDQDFLELIDYYHRYCSITTTGTSTSSLLNVSMRFDLSRIRETKRGNTPGLRTLTASILGLDLPKSTTIATSNWNTVPLNDNQIIYSARDAWISACIVHELQLNYQYIFNITFIQQSLQQNECSMITLYQRYTRRKHAKFVLSTFFQHHPKTKSKTTTTTISTLAALQRTQKSSTIQTNNNNDNSNNKDTITNPGTQSTNHNTKTLLNPVDIFSMYSRRRQEQIKLSSPSSTTSLSILPTPTTLLASASLSSSTLVDDSSSSITIPTTTIHEEHNCHLVVVPRSSRRPVITGWRATIVRELKQIMNTNIHDIQDIYDIRQFGLKLITVDTTSSTSISSSFVIPTTSTSTGLVRIARNHTT